jgi:hypothetical protein
MLMEVVDSEFKAGSPQNLIRVQIHRRYAARRLYRTEDLLQLSDVTRQAELCGLLPCASTQSPVMLRVGQGAKDCLRQAIHCGRIARREFSRLPGNQPVRNSTHRIGDSRHAKAARFYPSQTERFRPKTRHDKQIRLTNQLQPLPIVNPALEIRCDSQLLRQPLQSGKVRGEPIIAEAWGIARSR